MEGDKGKLFFSLCLVWMMEIEGNKKIRGKVVNKIVNLS